jgi:hypothetical protein
VDAKASIEIILFSTPKRQRKRLQKEDQMMPKEPSTHFAFVLT